MIMRIKAARKAAGLTQEELAEEMGVVHSAIANWEAERTFPRAPLLPQLAEVLGCSISELFEDPGETGPVSA